MKYIVKLGDGVWASGVYCGHPQRTTLQQWALCHASKTSAKRTLSIYRKKLVTPFGEAKIEEVQK